MMSIDHTHQGIRTSKDRVLQLLRENQLLSPARSPEPVRSNPHEGTILAELPHQMWGTDATATFTEREGTVTVFAAMDHCTAECVGIHAVKKATRFEALEPIRQGVKEHFGAFAGGTAAGLRLRHDHGSVYMSDDFQNEIRFLGIEPSPAFVRQPEGNACIERFFRTLKEQLLWIQQFRDLAELRAALIEFRNRYNHQWILQRLNYRTPVQARHDFILELQTAASFNESTYSQRAVQPIRSNTLNHTNFANPTATLSSSSFGTLLSANDPRILQFAMKLAF